jgi:hypothetical protein
MTRVLRWHLGPARQQDEGNDEAGRLGIPQGSAASPIVAEFVMADILRTGADLLEGLDIFNYSDNLGILLPGDRDEAAFMEHLLGVFATHRAGPFQLRTISTCDIQKPFRFLGYTWQKTKRGITAHVPVAFWREMEYEAEILEAQGLERIDHLEQRFRSYCGAFPLWRGATSMRARLDRAANQQRALMPRRTII